MLRQSEDLHFLANSRLDNLFQSILAMPTELARVRVVGEGHYFLGWFHRSQVLQAASEQT